MNSRERFLTTCQHQEPDRIPFDMGSTQITSIHVIAYQNLRAYLGLPKVTPIFSDVVQQLVQPDEDVVEKLGIDIRGLFPLNSHNWNIVEEEHEEYWEFHDEWGLTQQRLKPEGLYYSVAYNPLAGEITVDDVHKHAWPNTADPRRIAGLRAEAERYRAQGKVVMIKGVLAGIFEMAQRVRGMENLLLDLAADEVLAMTIVDKMVESKIKFWEMALPPLADVIDVVSEADDYGTQFSQLISPDMFRRLFKPRIAEVIRTIKKHAPQAKVFFHSDGNVRPIIPDFIEIGVDILNPIQPNAAGMEPLGLKKDFGKDLVFWGGGVETQSVLPFGTPQDVRDDVQRNIEALAPGGGYIFNTVHNIQADVPPQNIMAMIETLRAYRS